MTIELFLACFIGTITWLVVAFLICFVELGIRNESSAKQNLDYVLLSLLWPVILISVIIARAILWVRHVRSK